MYAFPAKEDMGEVSDRMTQDARLRVSDPLTCQKDVEEIEQFILIKKKPPRKQSTNTAKKQFIR